MAGEPRGPGGADPSLCSSPPPQDPAGRPAPPVPAAAGPERSAGVPARRSLGGLLAPERALGSPGRSAPQSRHREDRPAGRRPGPLPSVSTGVATGPRFGLATRVGSPLP